jgi:hypothetical protein
VADSETNRALVSEILGSVAKQCDLRDDSQRVSAISYPPGGSQLTFIVAYAADCPDTPKQPIWLYAVVEEGNIHVDLFHAKWHKARTARYLEIENALKAKIDKHFEVAFTTFDEVVK